MSRFARTKSQTKRAQKLRGETPNAEKILWKALRRRQLMELKFRRQHPVGVYFLDFYCPEIKLCIELDGDQHSEDKAIIHDAKRTAYLEACGICVLRFWNVDVYENIESVIDAILDQAKFLQQDIHISQQPLSSPWKGEG